MLTSEVAPASLDPLVELMRTASSITTPVALAAFTVGAGAFLLQRFLALDIFGDIKGGQVYILLKIFLKYVFIICMVALILAFSASIIPIVFQYLKKSNDSNPKVVSLLSQIRGQIFRRETSNEHSCCEFLVPRSFYSSNKSSEFTEMEKTLNIIKEVETIDPENLEVKLRKSNALTIQGDFPTSKDILMLLINKNPFDREYLFHLAEVEALFDVDKSLNIFEKFLCLSKNIKNPQQSAETYMFWIMGYYNTLIEAKDIQFSINEAGKQKIKNIINTYNMRLVEVNVEVRKNEGKTPINTLEYNGYLPGKTYNCKTALSTPIS